jgi:hypothetical protein
MKDAVHDWTAIQRLQAAQLFSLIRPRRRLNDSGHTMRLILIAVISWIAGVAAYVGSGAFLWRQTVSGGDLRAVLFWSALASTVAVVLVYAPVMFALRKWMGRAAGIATYASASVLLGVIPVLLIVGLLGGNPSSILSPEALLFYCMFTAFGFVFGAGFSSAYGVADSDRTQGPSK